MKNGFIKVAALSPAITLADCEKNAEIAANVLKDAAALGADLAVFPEMFLSGSTCGDLLKNRALVSSASDALDSFLNATADIETICFIGLPAIIEGKTQSCAAVCLRGELLGLIARGSAEIFECANVNGLRIGIVIGDDPFLTNELCGLGATVIVNLASTPQTVGSDKKAVKAAELDSERLVCGYISSKLHRQKAIIGGLYSFATYILVIFIISLIIKFSVTTICSTENRIIISLLAFLCSILGSFFGNVRIAKRKSTSSFRGKRSSTPCVS